MRTPASLRCWIALGLACLVMVVAAWSVLPPFAMPLIALTVAATELSPALLGASLAVLLLAAPPARDAAPGVRRARIAALVLGACGVASAVATLARIPSAHARMHAACVEGFGGDWGAADAGVPFRLVGGSGEPAADAVRTTRDLAISPHQLADLHRPPGDAVLPVVISVHGGGWTRGSRRDHESLDRALAAGGRAVLAIDYRLSPRAVHPEARDDVRAAVRWVAEHGPRLGLDPGRIALVGHSAGGHLAMLAAFGDGAPAVRGVVSYAGPVDLERGYRDPPRPDPLDVRALMRAYLGGTPDGMPERYRDASPITSADRRQQPTLLVHGGRDHAVEIAFVRELAQRLRASGTPVALLEVPWAEHGFEYVPSGPGAQLARHHVERFLDRVLRH